MNNLRGALFGAVLIFFLLSIVSGYTGLSPPSYEVNFEPGAKKDFAFEVFGDIGGRMEISLVGGDELQKYASLSTKRLQGPGVFVVSIKFPRAMETPGYHALRVALDEKVDEKGGVVGVATALRGKIVVFVPYPGKYAEAQLEVKDTKAGEQASYALKVSSLGNELISITPKIVLYDFNNKSKESFILDTRAVESTKSETYEGQLNVANYPAGVYRATAFVDYGGRKLAESTSYFRIGTLFVNILNYTKYVTKDSLNKFDIEVESQWNDPIQNVYAEVSIPEYNINFRTPAVELGGFQRTVLTGYFDTRGIDANSFKANIKIYYADKITEKKVTVRFKKEIDYLMIGLIAGFLLLIGIIIWLIMYIKKLNSRKNTKKRGKWFSMAKKKGNIKLSIIIFIFILIVLSFFTAIYLFFSPLERQIIEVRFSIADYVGFEPNLSVLSFGAIVPGGSLQRFITIRNDYKYPVKVKVLMSKQIRSFLSLNAPEVLMPGENRTLSVVVYAPENAKFGKYEGKIVFEFWKINNS